MITEPGIYAMPASEYHADPAPEPSLSASIATILIQQSPLHAKAAHPRLTPNPAREEARHLDLGTICHALMLEGESGLDKVHVITATRFEGRGKARYDTGEPVTNYLTDAAKNERDEARAAGKCPILAHELPAIHAMMQACREQLAESDCPDAFTNGKPEQTLIWQEPNGTWCRARLDWLMLDKPVIYDYKTGARSAKASSISRIAAPSGWCIQDSFYRRGFRAVFGAYLDPIFRFVCQENYEPFALSIVETSPSDLALADGQVEHAIGVFGECLKSGKWPGYSRHVERITSPPYYEVSAMEDMNDGN